VVAAVNSSGGVPIHCDHLAVLDGVVYLEFIKAVRHFVPASVAALEGTLAFIVRVGGAEVVESGELGLVVGDVDLVVVEGFAVLSEFVVGARDGTCRHVKVEGGGSSGESGGVRGRVVEVVEVKRHDTEGFLGAGRDLLFGSNLLLLVDTVDGGEFVDGGKELFEKGATEALLVDAVLVFNAAEIGEVVKANLAVTFDLEGTDFKGLRGIGVVAGVVSVESALVVAFLEEGDFAAIVGSVGSDGGGIEGSVGGGAGKGGALSADLLGQLVTLEGGEDFLAVVGNNNVVSGGIIKGGLGSGEASGEAVESPLQGFTLAFVPSAADGSTVNLSDTATFGGGRAEGLAFELGAFVTRLGSVSLAFLASLGVGQTSVGVFEIAGVVHTGIKVGRVRVSLARVRIKNSLELGNGAVFQKDVRHVLNNNHAVSIVLGGHPLVTDFTLEIIAKVITDGSSHRRVFGIHVKGSNLEGVNIVVEVISVLTVANEARSTGGKHLAVTHKVFLVIEHDGAIAFNLDGRDHIVIEIKPLTLKVRVLVAVAESANVTGVEAITVKLHNAVVSGLGGGVKGWGVGRFRGGISGVSGREFGGEFSGE